MVIFFSEQDFLSGKNGPIAICCAVERLNATLFKVERLNASLLKDFIISTNKLFHYICGLFF